MPHVPSLICIIIATKGLSDVFFGLYHVRLRVMPDVPPPSQWRALRHDLEKQRRVIFKTIVGKKSNVSQYKLASVRILIT